METQKEKFVPRQGPFCYIDKDAEVPGETDAPKQESAAHKKASLHMWVKKAWKKNRGRERVGRAGWGVGGSGWDGMRGREGRMLCRWFIKN